MKNAGLTDGTRLTPAFSLTVILHILGYLCENLGSYQPGEKRLAFGGTGQLSPPCQAVQYGMDPVLFTANRTPV